LFAIISMCHFYCNISRCGAFLKTHSVRLEGTAHRHGENGHAVSIHSVWRSQKAKKGARELSICRTQSENTGATRHLISHLKWYGTYSHNA
jgi:hypothetical protein